MLASPPKSPQRAAAAERLKEWTRRRFGLAPDDVISVAQIECAVPGCPPLETVVSFWAGGETRYHFKVFKPLEQLAEDDLPPAWFMPALAVPEGAECGCC
jgi:hypothetical protein